MMTIHIGFEAKGIQSWILAGGRLKDIAGGSEILEKLCTDDLQAALAQCHRADARSARNAGDRPEIKPDDGRVLTAAAGGFRLILQSASAAKDFMRLWPLIVAERAPGLRYAFAAVAQSDATGSAAPVERLNERLRHSANLPEAYFPVATPLFLRSQRVGLPVVGVGKQYADDTDEPEAVDAATLKKRAVFSRRKGRHESDDTRLLEKKLGLSGGEFATETDVLESAAPNATLAYIHADANRMGQVFIDLQTALGGRPKGPELIAKISVAIGNITQAAARKALSLARKGVRDNQNQIPARPVVLGGDDVTIVLPGDRGLLFAEAFLEEFQTQSALGLEDLREEIRSALGLPRGANTPLPTGLAAAAGIAFVHSHYPARVAHDLAENLCKFAKKPFRTNDVAARSALAFHRVTASAVDDYDDILDRELTVREGWDPPLRLTMGPYVVTPGDAYADQGHPTVRALHALLDVARALPRGSWRELVTLCYESQGTARNRYGRILEVARKAGRAQAADTLESILEGLACDGTAFWCKSREAGADLLRTPIPDVAALMSVDRAVDREHERRGDAA